LPALSPVFATDQFKVSTRVHRRCHNYNIPADIFARLTAQLPASERFSDGRCAPISIDLSSRSCERQLKFPRWSPVLMRAEFRVLCHWNYTVHASLSARSPGNAHKTPGRALYRRVDFCSLDRSNAIRIIAISPSRGRQITTVLQQVVINGIEFLVYLRPRLYAVTILGIKENKSHSRLIKEKP